MHLHFKPDMTRPNRISPSGLKTFQECAKKFEHKYMLKTPMDPGQRTGGAALGTKVHKALEDRVRGQIRLFPESDHVEILAERMYDGTKGLVEQRFALEFEDLWFHGIIDVLMDNGFTDWKTSKDPAKYAIKKKDMPTDPQNVIYSAVALLANDLTETLSRYVYGRTTDLTKGPTVEVWNTKAEVMERLEFLYAQAFEALYADEYPMNRDMCNEYGGCPYRSSCPMSAEEFLTL